MLPEFVPVTPLGDSPDIENYMGYGLGKTQAQRASREYMWMCHGLGPIQSRAVF